MKRSVSLVEQLEKMTDPRRGESVYPLVKILFMRICAVIAGADDDVAIAKFANAKKEWFAKFLDMSAGVPSHDRFDANTKRRKGDEIAVRYYILNKVVGGELLVWGCPIRC